MDDYFDVPPRNGIMVIAPELAEEWLKRRNKNNRNVSPRTVKRYAEAMKEGRWQLTHQGIAFDEHGNLIDGQHRLQACAESKVAIEVMVTVGLGRETFAVVDSGRRRHASQLLHIPNSTTIVAAARILSYLTEALPPDTPTHGRVVPAKVDNDILLRTVDEWPELEQYAAKVSAAYAGARILKSAHLTVVAQAARGDHADRLEPWFEGVISGAGLARDDARLVLRNRFLQGGEIKSGGATRMAHAYLLVVKAWNAYATETPIKILKVLPDQIPPTVR